MNKYLPDLYSFALQNERKTLPPSLVVQPGKIMDKTRLAAKFKRVSEWKEYLAGPSPSETTKIRLLALLPKYEGALKDIWEAQEVKPDLEKSLVDLERQLEDADEQARMFTSGR